MGEEALRDVPLSESPPPAAAAAAAAESIIQSLKIPISSEDSSSSSDSSPSSPTRSHSSSVSSSSSEEDSNAKKDGEEEPIKKQQQTLIHPAIHLRKPEAPHAAAHLTKTRSTGPEDSRPSLDRSISTSESFSTISRFFKERSSSLSSAITKHISSFNTNATDDTTNSVTEFNLSGLKVIVNLKNSEEDGHEDDNNDSYNLNLKGRISFFSRSNCRDSTAVRTFFRQKGLPYVEINVDVFLERERELKEMTGSSSVPQIFFNEKLVGGLVVLNSLRNSGEFDRRLREMAGRKCPESAPRVPVYGFDDEEEMRRVKVDAMVGVVRVLRQRLPIQDRLMKMKIVKNCFAGSEMVEGIIHLLDCGRKKAVEIGKELARKHFIHHVFRENDFEDGNNQFYRFLEHDPTIPKCFNFRGTTNDDEPKTASVIGQRLTKLMSAILEAYASGDRRHLDYTRIAASEEFRRYINLVADLQRVDIFTLAVDETMAFFLNLYNAMVIHAVIRIGKPSVIDRRAFFSDFHYIVGGYPSSLSTIKNGILRTNRRQPYSFIKPFNAGDKRLELALPTMNPLIHFGLCNGARSSPTVRFFSVQGVEVELRYAAREFFLDGGIEVDLSKRTVYLTRIIKWYSMDFGQDREILNWILNYLDATKAGLLTHLLNDGGPINIAYQKFDWSLNF